MLLCSFVVLKKYWSTKKNKRNKLQTTHTTNSGQYFVLNKQIALCWKTILFTIFKQLTEELEILYSHRRRFWIICRNEKRPLHWFFFLFAVTLQLDTRQNKTITNKPSQSFKWHTALCSAVRAYMLHTITLYELITDYEMVIISLNQFETY